MKQLFVSLKGSSLHIMMDMILKHTFLALYFILTILFCLVFSCFFFSITFRSWKPILGFRNTYSMIEICVNMFDKLCCSYYRKPEIIYLFIFLMCSGVVQEKTNKLDTMLLLIFTTFTAPGSAHHIDGLVGSTGYTWGKRKIHKCTSMLLKWRKWF